MSPCTDDIPIVLQTYKDGWSYHNEFHKSCSYIQPVSMMEASMHKCLMDGMWYLPVFFHTSFISFYFNYR